MSRRQSRVSIDARQNDTLLEFENFKKKFLLANKHITKLNSTLSARIEELQAQISTLYVENLRLRASEIALTSQLKREREKSRKILADTESATHSLMKQLGLIRKSFGVPHARSSTPEAVPQPPRARRPIPDPNVSPPPNRVARPPTIPVLLEDEEPNQSSPEDVGVDEIRETSPPLFKKRAKSKPRISSTSRLPVPLSKSPTPAVEVIQLDFDDQLNKTGKRRPSRRQSGLLTSVSITATVTDGLDRPPSPAPASPIHRALEEDDFDAAEPDDDEVEAILQSVSRRKSKKGRESECARESDVDVPSELPRPRERRRRVIEEPLEAPEGSKLKLKDVTNAQTNRSTLPLLDTASDRDRQQTPDADAPTSATSYASTSTRNFLSTPATTPAPPSKLLSQLATPRSSSPLEPPPPSESEPSATVRERRVRKSVNYAEPKLNTKMRKPDPPISSLTSKRSSTSGAPEEPLPLSSRSSSSNAPEGDPESALAGTARRKKSRTQPLPEDEDESEGTQADAEFGSLRTGNWGSVDVRRRSVHSSSSRRVEGDDTRRHSMAV